MEKRLRGLRKAYDVESACLRKFPSIPTEVVAGWLIYYRWIACAAGFQLYLDTGGGGEALGKPYKYEISSAVLVQRSRGGKGEGEEGGRGLRIGERIGDGIS